MATDLPETSDVRMALDTLDDLLFTDGLDAVSDEDLNAVDTWANNIQLDIMRLRHRREGKAARKEAHRGH